MDKSVIQTQIQFIDEKIDETEKLLADPELSSLAQEEISKLREENVIIKTLF